MKTIKDQKFLPYLISLKCIFLLVLSSLSILGSVSAEESIFQRSNGEFTNVANGEEAAKAVELPTLETVSTEERKAEFRSIADFSCISHGGFDCPRGADNDGSVICVDGFSKSAERYQEFCSSSRIVIEYLVEFEDGEQQRFSRVFRKHSTKKPKKKITALVANIRNPSSVEAVGVEARLYLPYILDEPAVLRGDTIIPGYEVRRLEIPFRELNLDGRFHYMSAARFEVRCTNCKTTRSQR